MFLVGIRRGVATAVAASALFASPSAFADDASTLAAIADRGLQAWLPGIATLAIAVSIAVVLAALWRGPLRPARNVLLKAVHAIDHALVTQGSWIVGTRVRRRGARWATVIFVLTAVGTLGAFLPGVFGFAALFLGLIAILIVYRHWSWDEDEVAAEVPEDEKRVPITGTLRNEVLTAVAFLFFYYPIAFAKLQADGGAFTLVPGSGLAALSVFTLLEFVKAVPFVDYYEIFGPNLRFDEIAAVGEPTITGKVLTLALRASFDLVLVAAILRLPEIARLAQEGRDLRPIDEALSGEDEDKQMKAIDAACAFALNRRPRARERLVRVTERRWSSDRFRYSPQVRLSAADALVRIGASLNDEAAFMAAASVYRQTFDDPQAMMSGIGRARRKHDYGNIMATLASSRSDTLFLDEAVAAYHDAMVLLRRDLFPKDWAMAQLNLGIALNKLANRADDTAKRDEALQAFHNALLEYDRERFPIEWARVQLNLGNALCDAGRDRPELQREGIAALRAGLEVRTKERDAPGWARTQHNLGVALYDYWHSTGADDTYAQEAIAAYEAALTVRTERDGSVWADSQERLGTVLSRLGRKQNDAALLTRAVGAYRASLQRRRREALPLDWAQVQNNIGLTLLALGELKADARIVREAATAFGLALEERTQTRAPVEWARTTHRLADAEALIATMTRDAAARTRAAALYAEAIPVLKTNDPEFAAEAEQALSRLNPSTAPAKPE